MISALRELSDPSRLVDRPVVSILVLAYNHEPFLSGALESLVRQEANFPFEIIIGEDHSSDGTVDVALQYQRQHPDLIRVLTSERNVGMHENHRRVVKASRGDFLAYCEGDDYWNATDKLARQVALLRARPRVGLVHSEFAHVAQISGRWRALPEFWRHHNVAPREGRVFDELLMANFIQTCTLTIRSELVRQFLESGLPVDSYRVIDWGVCLFASADHEVAYIDRPLASYRRVWGSATNAGALSDIGRALDSVRMRTDLARYFGVAEDVQKQIEANGQRTVLVTALRAGLLTEAQGAKAWLDNNAPAQLSNWERLGSRVLTRVPGALRVYASAAEIANTRRDRLAYSGEPLPPGSSIA